MRYLCLFLCLFITPAWATFTPTTVAKVDLKRYMGKWYEVAKIPNTFQKSCIQDITATYSLLANNQVKGVNSCRKANGQVYQMAVQGTVKDNNNAKLGFKITSSWLRWVPMLEADYWIVDLAEDYSHAAVSTADGKYLWILARQPQLAEPVYQQVLQRAAKLGFAIDKVVKNKS
jgi:apolipoprotein D and lipocalin family protein